MAERRKSLRREQQNGRELLSFVKNPSPQASDSRPSLWGCLLSPAKALVIPQYGKQLTKDCFSIGCGLSEMPRGHVGNHLAGTNLGFGHLAGQISQAVISLIMPSLPWKETSRTADTNGSIGAEPMRCFILATRVILSRLKLLLWTCVRSYRCCFINPFL